MKKSASAILMFILVFNWFGYRLMVDCLQQKVDSRLEVSIDNHNYDENQLIELKIPMHLPYQNSWSAYERYDGEVEYNGSFYKYVKRKLANDTLYLKCLNNPAKTRAELAKNDFYKDTNDLSQGGKSSQSKTTTFKKIIAEYDDYLSFHKQAVISVTHTTFGLTNGVGYLPNPIVFTPGQPPETTTLLS